jgi:hypothetical protein
MDGGLDEPLRACRRLRGGASNSAPYAVVGKAVTRDLLPLKTASSVCSPRFPQRRAGTGR